MKPHSLLSIFAGFPLLALVGCQNSGDMMSTADQAAASSSDMAGNNDPNRPGLVRYSYMCGNQPEKSVELPHVRFGATYWCQFMSNDFKLSVKDDRVPVEFWVSLPNYHGPGTYPATSYEFAGKCTWPYAIKVADKNCLPLYEEYFSGCCRTEELRARILNCTITVAEHSLTRVVGSFDCRIQQQKREPTFPDYCPEMMAITVRGSFDFGPKDCEQM